jgi:hypothetical protein
MLVQSKLAQALRRQLRQKLKVDLVSAGSTAGLSFNLEQVLREYRVDVVLDVGANEGQFGLLLRELGFKGVIHSFEPIGQAHAKLSAACASDPRWIAHKMALGRAVGPVTMNVSKETVFSSFFTLNKYGTTVVRNVSMTLRHLRS